MKRNSLTAIIGTVMYLTMRNYRYTMRDTDTERSIRYAKLIRRAAVSEIIRLDSSPVPSHDLAYKPGTVSAYQNEICKSFKP